MKAINFTWKRSRREGRKKKKCIAYTSINHAGLDYMKKKKKGISNSIVNENASSMTSVCLLKEETSFFFFFFFKNHRMDVVQHLSVSFLFGERPG